MAEYKIHVRTDDNREWDETFVDNDVVDDASAVAAGTRLLADYNETETQRYGKSAVHRHLVSAVFIDSSKREHVWEKMNAFTLMGGGHAPRDRWQCSVCGCVALRYGLSSDLRRTGKWAAKKYEFCSSTDTEQDQEYDK